MREEDKKGILLESGTNEIEIMEFTIDGQAVGILLIRRFLPTAGRRSAGRWGWRQSGGCRPG